MAMLKNQRVMLTFINSHSYPDGHTSGIQISCDSQMPQMSGWSQRYEGWENPLVLGVRSSSRRLGCPQSAWLSTYKNLLKIWGYQFMENKGKFCLFTHWYTYRKSMYKAKSCGDIPCYMALNQINKIGIGFYLLHIIIYIYIIFIYIYMVGNSNESLPESWPVSVPLRPSSSKSDPPRSHNGRIPGSNRWSY